MSLREFKNVLERMDNDFLSSSVDGSLLTELDSIAYKSLIYPVSAREESGGHVILSCPLPPVRVPLPQRRSELLLTYLGKKARSVVIDFDPEDKNFIVTAYLSPGSHEEELQEFQIECDLLFPLLLAIGEYGVWDEKFVDMILAPSQTLPQA